MSLYLRTRLVHIFDLCKKRLASPISHAKILIVFLLFSIGGIGNAYAIEIIYKYYPSPETANQACNNELDSYNPITEVPQCASKSMDHNIVEYYVTYVVNDDVAGLTRKRSKYSYIYKPSSTIYPSRSHALSACLYIATWVNVFGDIFRENR